MLSPRPVTLLPSFPHSTYQNEPVHGRFSQKDHLLDIKGSASASTIVPGHFWVACRKLGNAGILRSDFCEMTSSGNEHLILKELDTEKDWFSQRSGDTLGREAAVLVEPTLQGIHGIFELPYQYIGMEPGKIGMLMSDVSHGLFPDERKSISRQDQDLILDKFAEMHALFWEHPSLSSFSWLHQPEDFLYLMGPLDHASSESVGGSARNVQDVIKSGWKQAREILPEPVKELLFKNPQHITKNWENLPKTLVHGDTKIANFARMPSHQLCLLDWAFVGHAPCTVDIGWYLAVNATRLADPKEVVLRDYRNRLETHLEFHLDNELWNQLEKAGILCGALMLLWSKAKALDSDRDDARQEWDWWIDRLSFIGY